MRIALAQINPIVGDIAGNTSLVLKSIERAREAHATLVVFPELAVFGYPPKDLVRRQDLVRANVAAVDRIAEQCQGLTAVLGYVEPDPTGDGTGLFNAAAVCAGGVVIARYRKRLLPTYDVFDESRYFNPGQDVATFELTDNGRPVTAGVTICEDLWNDHQFEGRKVYDVDPVRQTVEAGVELLINCSGSPYRAGVQQDREALFTRQIREHGVPLIYVNQVGGNDDLIFDGASLVLDAGGRVIARAKTLEEDFLLVDLDNPGNNRIEPIPDRIDGIHKALVVGVRDYLSKCGFDSVVLGLSGGIDSAITAAVAVEAIGASHVHGIALPSRFSSDHSRNDAHRLAENLGITYSVIAIEETHRALEQAVEPFFAAYGNPSSTVAEENLQARIRGNILMALSNKSGALLLTTGNKSELAVGYCTLYGDMCGGLAVLSDVPKTVVYQLAERTNAGAGQELIPRNTIDKPPSAELRHDQTDQDTLPPYDVLDAILERYVEHETPVADIVAEGLDAITVERVTRMVDRSEYKRQQAAVGLKVTSRAFGTGRRMPIAAIHQAPTNPAAQRTGE